MKITAKVKLITIGVGAVLILGGIGTILWHHTQQNHQEPIFASQFQQKHQQKILSTSHYNNKIISQSDIDKPIEKQSKSQVSELAKPQSSSEVDSNSQRIAQPESKLTDIDKKKDKQDEKAKLKYEQGVESAKQQITELIVKYGEVVRGQEQYWSMSDSEKRKMDPNIADNYTDARRETGQVIMIAIANYVRLTGDHNASYPGGWIYEFGNKNSFHIAHE